MLFNGDGVTRDCPRAYALMTRASAAGLNSASRTLAEMDGFINPADRERGVALARQYEAQAKAMPAVAPVRTATRVGEASPPPSPGTPMQTTALPPSRPARAIEAPRPAPPSAEPMPRGGGWKVQLGAFRDRGNAEALWRRVAGRLRGASPSFVAGGGVTRLQAGGYPSKAAAASACAAAKGAGAQCVVVVP